MERNENSAKKTIELPDTRQAELADVLDKVIDKGAVVTGEAMLSVADVDLVILGLKLVLLPVRKIGGGRLPKSRGKDRLDIKKMEKKLREIELSLNNLSRAKNEKKAEEGIAKLVLSLVSLIKELLEREAVRRAESGGLEKKQIEKLGLSFKIMEKKIEEMKKIFGIDNLDIDLGPLGEL